MKFEKPYLEILLFDEDEILTTSTNAKNEAANTILGVGGGTQAAQAAVSVDINELTIRN